MNNTGSALFNLSPKFYPNFRQKFLYFQNEPWFHLRVHLHPLHPLILGLPKCTLAFILGVHLHLLHPPWIRAWLKVLLVSRLLMGWKLQIRGYKFVNLIVFEKCALPAIMVKFFWSWLSKVGAGLVHSDHGFYSHGHLWLKICPEKNCQLITASLLKWTSVFRVQPLTKFSYQSTSHLRSCPTSVRPKRP